MSERAPSGVRIPTWPLHRKTFTSTSLAMAYVKSAEAVESIRKSLSLLEEGIPCVWANPPLGPANFAYKVRQALAYAKEHPLEFPALARAYEIFEIKQHANRVEAKLRTRLSESAPTPLAPSPLPTPAQPMQLVTEMENVVPRASSVSVPGEHNHFSIIERCTSAKGALMSFPDVSLDAEALTKIYRWAKAQTPELMLMAEPGFTGLTVSPIDPEVEEFQWRPAVLEG